LCAAPHRNRRNATIRRRSGLKCFTGFLPDLSADDHPSIGTGFYHRYMSFASINSIYFAIPAFNVSGTGKQIDFPGQGLVHGAGVTEPFLDYCGR
jgi:hypothetical protein